jgi:hypothetical protein
MKVKDFTKSFNDYMDVSRQAYVHGTQLNTVVNTGLDEFISTRDEDVETQRRKDDLHRYVKRVTFSGSSKVNRANLSNYFKLDALNAKFNFECDGEVNTLWRPCTPKSHDEYTRELLDPDNKAEDFFPVYLMTDSVFEIKSDTIPLQVEVIYKRSPNRFDYKDLEADVDIDDTNIPDLLKICARLALEIIESPRYNNQVSVENPIIK